LIHLKKLNLIDQIFRSQIVQLLYQN